MSSRGKILLSIFGIAFVALIIWVVQTTPDSPPPIDKVKPPTSMEYEGNTISEEVNGVKIWDLTADKVTIDIKTQNAELQNIVGHFYQEDGKSIELNADYGTYENDNKNVHVEGHVIVTTSEGAKLTSGKLDWISKDEILIASDKVKILKDDVQATGDRAESKDGFRRFLLKGRAHIIKGIKNNSENK